MTSYPSHPGYIGPDYVIGKATERVGTFAGEPWGVNYPVGLVLEVRTERPQHPETSLTTEHLHTPADAVGYSFVWVATCRRRDPYLASTPGGCFPEMLAEGSAVTFCDGWNRERLLKASELAERWHLNQMRAACAHQEIVYELDRYGRAVPSLDLTPACPGTPDTRGRVRGGGYRYGSAWLFEVVPDEVAAEIAETMPAVVVR